MKAKIEFGEEFQAGGTTISVLSMPSTPVPVKLLVNGVTVTLLRNRRQQVLKVLIDSPSDSTTPASQPVTSTTHTS